MSELGEISRLDFETLVSLLEGSPQSIFYEGLGEEQISVLETKLGVRLPPSFKRFLKVTNGGEFYQEITVFGNIDSFDRQQESMDLTKRQLRDLPAHLLPFGQGLEYYCFDLSKPRGEEYEVVVWSQDNKTPSKLADSFTEWLSKEVIGKNELT